MKTSFTSAAGPPARVADGTEVPYVATADNAWMAVAVNGMVGWVKIE